MTGKVAAAALVLVAGFCPMAEAEAPYAGFDARAVSSLSGEDIAALERGEGWGLALPAELNGWPGPRHVLELADALAISLWTELRVTAVFQSMRAAAIELGGALIEAERALDAAFETGEIDAARLAELLSAAEAARAALRAVHLEAHLATRPLLTEAEAARYAELRGYSAAASDHSGQGHGHQGHGHQGHGQ